MASQSSSRDTALLRVALVLFFVGVIAVIAAYVVFALGHEPPLSLYLTAIACPVGLVLAIVFALRSGRRVREGE
ncbi:hypothetical protein [Rhodococcus kronopolitis]|uniref:Uncharacterized protein n=1 Tax=Rhodococcus kronopolitis TaxID=1460226 RepID=A0ABV9FR42_9NOCA